MVKTSPFSSRSNSCLGLAFLWIYPRSTNQAAVTLAIYPKRHEACDSWCFWKMSDGVQPVRVRYHAWIHTDNHTSVPMGPLAATGGCLVLLGVVKMKETCSLTGRNIFSVDHSFLRSSKIHLLVRSSMRWWDSVPFIDDKSSVASSLMYVCLQTNGKIFPSIWQCRDFNLPLKSAKIQIQVGSLPNRGEVFPTGRSQWIAACYKIVKPVWFGCWEISRNMCVKPTSLGGFLEVILFQYFRTISKIENMCWT